MSGFENTVSVTTLMYNTSLENLERNEYTHSLKIGLLVIIVIVKTDTMVKM